MVFAIISAILFITAEAGYSAPAEPSKNLKIIATIFPAYDFARAVAGDKAEISMLVRPGSEIHSFDPSPQDIIAIHNADVFICIGGESETWVNTLLGPLEPGSSGSGKTVLRLIDHIDAVEEEIVEGMQSEEEEEEEAYDEHIWTSPRNAAALVGAVADALCASDPSNAGEYRSRADNYAGEIDALSTEFKALAASAKRKKIVFGDRFPFRYFADEFGLEYRAAFPGCHTESDVSVATMAYLMKYVESEDIPVVYTLELGSGNIARAIAEQTGAEVLTLHSCHNVTRSEFESGVTYVSLMRKNLESLRKGLY
jgi:zinc transport system substrate-binding protein